MMDARLGNRGRGESQGRRASRAFSPPPHQFVQQQQLPHASYNHASGLSHRLSVLDDHFPSLSSHPAASGAPIPLDPTDYAAILAYRQRVNGFLSPHPRGMVSHVPRSQTAIWSQAERPQDSRLDDYSRQSAFLREYREDLRSMSELDNSRRSAALSAKLFLDDTQPISGTVFQRSTQFEGSRNESNRCLLRREEVSQDSPTVKASQRLGEYRLGKRGREEGAVDYVDRSTRHNRFHNPGLSALSRTPEMSRDCPLVRRLPSSSQFARELEDRRDGHGAYTRALSPHERKGSIFNSPTKSTRKKLATQSTKRSPMEVRNAFTPLVKRLHELEEESEGLKGHGGQRTFEPHFYQHDARRNSKHSKSSPTPDNAKRDADASIMENGWLSRSNTGKGFSLREGCTVAAGASTTRASDKEQEPVERSRKQRVTARSLNTIRKALRVVEATPRSKNVKSRVLRLLGTDAKVCGNSPSGGCTQESNVEVDPHIRKASTSCNQLMQQDEQTLQLPERLDNQKLQVVKQEQCALTDVQGRTACVDEGSGEVRPYITCSMDSNQLAHVEQLPLNLPESSLLSSMREELGPLPWCPLVANSGLSSHQPATMLSPCFQKEGGSMELKNSQEISSSMQSLIRSPFHEVKQATTQGLNLNDAHGLLHPLSNPGLAAPMTKKPDKEFKTQNWTSVSESNEVFAIPEGNGITRETTEEREVRIFGKSLKAPVVKVNKDNIEASMTLDLSLKRVQTQGSSAAQLVSDGHTVLTGLDSVVSAEADTGAFVVYTVGGKAQEATSSTSADMATMLALSFSDTVLEQCSALLSSPKNLLEASAVADALPILASQQQVVLTDSVLDTKALDTPSAVHSMASLGQGNVVMSTTKLAEVTGEPPAIVVKEPAVSSDQVSEPHTDVVAGEHSEPVLASLQASQPQRDAVAGEALLSQASTGVEGVCQTEIVITASTGKSEAQSLEKLASHMLYKQTPVATLQPHGRLQSMPVRAGARTWRRSINNHGLSPPQTMSRVGTPLVPKVANQKVPEVAAYVRKGNSLVRAPISTVGGVSNTSMAGSGKDLGEKVFARAPPVYHMFRSVVKNSKPISRQVYSVQKSAKNETPAKLSSVEKPVAAGQIVNPSPNGHLVETGHLQMKSLACEGQPTFPEANSCGPNLNVQHRTPVSGIQAASGGPRMSESSATLYVKSKVNQIIASSSLTSSRATKTLQGTSSLGAIRQDLYYKRSNNQLVRNGTEIGKQLQNLAPQGQTQRACRTTSKKVLKKRAYLPASRVWTLKDGSSQVKSVLPLLFPWKRTGMGVGVSAGKFKALPKAKKGSLLFMISKKLQRLRKVQLVYSRSAGGFSLHRSGLLSLTGTNLKWTKSIERRSKQASEEATKAVAAVEKQRRDEKVAKAVSVAASAVAKAKAHRRVSCGRERIVTIGLARYKMDPKGRTLQRLADQWCGPAEASSQLKRGSDSAILPTPRRLSFDGTEYVRIGNGNQLVRDPKAASRALANEKVRWSLHTARFRRAKKQQYCLFFTRFGKCNKSEGECPYIHDPEKVAVCTKFLKGTCSGTNCLFSHKVNPERMPDCSFFLEGMCANEDCPYRHVSVNPKAPICEGFLKGFCADGDECNKKHTRVCPAFAANGECPEKSTCKLHHPRKKMKRASSCNFSSHGKAKRRRRYFGIGNSTNFAQPADSTLSSSSFVGLSNQRLDSAADEGGCVDFIDVPEILIDFDQFDEFQRRLSLIKEQLPALPEGLPGQEDTWIKPVLLLQRQILA